MKRVNLGRLIITTILAALCIAPQARSDDDATAVRQAIRNNYAAYSSFDERRYRALLVDDYLLLENGEMIGREGDVASMAKPGTGYQRSDTFDFRQVKVERNIAYAVYFLTSDIHDDVKGSRHREWLESAILKRSNGAWQMALLHSTRIATPAEAPDMKSFATRYTAAWCSRNPASVASFFAENGSLRINDGAPSVGRVAITEAARGFMSAFPDMVVEMDGLDRQGDGYIYRWTLTGTNTGPGGSGNKVRISGYEEWTIGPDGLVAASLGHFDATDYDRQLAGKTLVPAPEYWAPVKFLLGEWTGTVTGQAGNGTVVRRYDFILGQRFIRETSRSTYPPQQGNPQGEVHEHHGYFSYDKARKLIVMRQFHVEGFVNQYVLAPDTGTMANVVFDSESFENFSNDWRARETYQILGPEEFVEIFELAPPGKDFEMYSRNHLRRVSD